MFKRRKKNKDELQEQINKHLVLLREMEPGTKLYSQRLQAIERLQALRKDRDEGKITKETALKAGLNIIGILTILTYERTNVIATKALGFVFKGRV